MIRAIKRYFNAVIHFFPVQLIVISLRKHQIFLFFWLFLFLIIVGKFAASFGVPYLFLEPEYLGKVGYLSFALVGMSFGVFYVTWNIVSYMLHSHRFKFLASLENPLSVFFINNSIVPLIFVIGYISAIIRFQKYFAFQSWHEVGMDIAGFAAGFVFVIILISIYFQIANKSAKNIASSYKVRMRRKRFLKKIKLNEELEFHSKWRVDSFVSNHLQIRATQKVVRLEDKLNRLVFRQHHLNALIVQLATIALLIGIGFFIENPFFQIPTSASSFLLISVLTSLVGVIIYWAWGWGTFVIVVLVFFVNYMSKYDILGYQSRAYGLNYTTKPASYTFDTLRAIASEENIEKDKAHFVGILENWKKNNTSANRKSKPKIVFITASGGGLRAAAFTMACMQKADSLIGGDLMKKTFLMNGASGGSFALTYYRELYARKMKGEVINLADRKYFDNLSLDLLNPMGISILSNDLFLPIHKFKLDSQVYYRDRAYMFERYFANNTGLDFKKTLADYHVEEDLAQIPVLLYHTASTSDSRTFYISSQPVRFLMRPYNKRSVGLDLTIDAIDFRIFFAQQNGAQLNVLSAMRMGASFPFILPSTILPCEPPAYVIDGGALDNFGMTSVTKFLINFKDWINKNTSGVVIIQTRDSQKDEAPEKTKQLTLFQRAFQPVETIFGNMENIQDFENDQKMAYINEELQGKIQFVLFEYIPEKKTEKASMSLRLTAREKNEIFHALELGNNSRSFEILKRALSD